MQDMSKTGLTTLTKSLCVIPVRFNRHNMYNRLPAFFTIFSTCLFHVRSWEMVTPNSLAWQTCAISLPSIFIFGIVLLKLQFRAKLMIISFEFSEFIVMFCSATSNINQLLYDRYSLYLYLNQHVIRFISYHYYAFFIISILK